MKSGGANLAVAELGRLVDTIDRLSRVPRRVATIAAPQIEAELKKQFYAGLDPYGRPWRPLRPATIAKGRTPPPLTDTKALRDGTKARAVPGGRAGIRITLGAFYGFFHQVGFRVGRTRVGPRRILPQFGMPATWMRILRDASRQAFREAK